MTHISLSLLADPRLYTDTQNHTHIYDMEEKMKLSRLEQRRLLGREEEVRGK